MIRNRTNHPISDRHFRQVVCRPTKVSDAMMSLLILSWRPGDQSGSFLHQTLRPFASPLLVVVHYEYAITKGRARTKVNLLGYKTEVNHVTGEVYFGGPDRNVFSYDFGLRPHIGAKGRILDPRRNPSLGYLGLEMDRIAQNYAERSYSASAIPVLPTIYLGFNDDKLPAYEDTPGLRARVAHHMHRSLADIDAMGGDALKPFLEAEWDGCFVKPGEAFNDSTLHLISHELCTRVHQSLRMFECYEELLGAEIYNPAMELLNPRDAIANPTIRVAEALGIDITQATRGDEDGDDELGITLEKGVREALGWHASLCSEEDVIDMLMSPEEPIVPSGLNDLTDLDERNTVELMRIAVGRHADACADEDLVAAARRPSKPLYARGLCGVQVLRFDPANRPESLQFGHAELDRQRTQVDVGSTRHYWSGNRGRENSRQPA